MLPLLGTASLLAAGVVGYLTLVASVTHRDRLVLWLILCGAYVAMLSALLCAIHGGRWLLWRVRRPADVAAPSPWSAAALAVATFAGFTLVNQATVAFCYRKVVRLELPPLGRLPFAAEIVFSTVAFAVPFLLRRISARLAPRGARRWLRFAAVAAPVVLLLPPAPGRPLRTVSSAGGASAATVSTARRQVRPVLLLCLDGLDATLLDAARRSEKLPAFDRLRTVGLTASLDNEDYGFSPVVWNSIATGKAATVHGIYDFYARSSPLFEGPVDAWWPQVPPGFWVRAILRGVEDLRLIDTRVVTGSDRRGPSLWQILSAAGRSSLVVNYLQSYPAERIDGVFLAGNLYWSKSQPPTGGHEGLTAPAGAGTGFEHPGGTLARLRSGPAPVKPARVGHGLVSQSGDEFRFLSALTLRLARERPFDVITFYSVWPDVFNHRFTVGELEAMRAGRFETARARAYLRMCREVDGFVQRLAELGPEANLVVLSDHGVNLGYTGKARTTHHQQGAPGVLLAMGPDVHPEAGSTSISMYDILPTFLHYFGLPVGRDLLGQVDRRLLDNPEPVAQVESWEALVQNARVKAERGEPEEAVRERLRALGYVE